MQFGLTILVIGGTGLLGSNFVIQSSKISKISKIIVLVRRTLPQLINLPKVELIINKDSSQWSSIIENLPTDIDIIFSSLSSSKGLIDQMKIDLDLNMELIKTTQRYKHATKVIIVTSFNNKIISQIFPYFQLKQKIEDSIISLNYPQTLILRPGPLVGDRSILNTNIALTTKISSKIANWTYNTPCSSILGFSIKNQEVIYSAIYLLENKDHIKIVTSQEMFALNKSL